MALGGSSSSASPGRFAAGAVLGVLMFLPAAGLVWRGQLSADEALMRFGLAWLVAVGGVALLSATFGSAAAPAPVPRNPAEHASSEPEDPSA